MFDGLDLKYEPGLITAKEVLKLAPFRPLLNHQAPKRIFVSLANTIAKEHTSDRVVRIKLLGGEIACNKQNGIFYASMMGAPAILFLLEILCEWGVKEFVGIGMAGLISHGSLEVGNIVFVKSAFSDEGSSQHYGKDDDQLVNASTALNHDIMKSFESQDLKFKIASCASTDAFFRETNSKIAFYRTRDCDLIDMESSAFLQFGFFKQVQTSMILLISDSLLNQQWRPAFDSSAVQNSKKSLSKWLFTQLSDNYS